MIFIYLTGGTEYIAFELTSPKKRKRTTIDDIDAFRILKSFSGFVDLSCLG